MADRPGTQTRTRQLLRPEFVCKHSLWFAYGAGHTQSRLNTHQCFHCMFVCLNSLLWFTEKTNVSLQTWRSHRRSALSSDLLLDSIYILAPTFTKTQETMLCPIRTSLTSASPEKVLIAPGPHEVTKTNTQRKSSAERGRGLEISRSVNGAFLHPLISVSGSSYLHHTERLHPQH